MGRKSIILACVLLTGCVKGAFHPDPFLLQECPPIYKAEKSPDGDFSMGDLLLDNIKIQGMYEECSAIHSGLVKSVKSYLDARKAPSF